MKRLLLIILMGVAAIAQAQEPPPPRMGRMPGGMPPPPPPGERPNIEAIKVAYITKQLNLNTEEAQKFWPLHNAYMAELKKAREANRDAELAFEEQALSIRKKYNNDFKKILNAEDRVNTVFKLDRNFNDMMRQEMMKRGMKPGGPEGRSERPALRKRLMQKNRADSSLKKN
ncbi:hypothetical protein [Sediminibacterium sp.]|uniref:hypothetical protein n=1 Tax=Sediminibacterium sp. TaxID=1917865 RepID=UPI003F704B83